MSERVKGFTMVLMIVLVSLGLAVCPALGEVKLKIASGPHPVQKHQIKWMEKWALLNPDVEVEPIILSYDVYFTKVSNAIQSSKCEYDFVWHNDDWGAAWMNHMEYVDDVKHFDNVPQHLWNLCFKDKNGRSTAVPFIGTSGAMFYRKDLISTPPKTWKETQELGMKLQKEGKTKWGYVASMKYPHAYFTFLPFMWANLADISYPPFVRDSEMLEMFGWQTMVTDVRVVEMLEFWWDQMHRYKTAPRDMVSYSRDAAGAIFMAGDCAMYANDTQYYGTLNDPQKSKVAGKVGIAPFPCGPHGNGPLSWDVAWAWAVPRNISAEKKKAAKDLLGYLLGEEIQVDMWKKTGGIPTSVNVRSALKKSDPLFAEFAKATFDAAVLVAAAHYYPKWPQVHSIFTDYCIKAVSGKKEDIGKVMEECAAELGSVYAR
jgi:ABC-type glycerol-3-phosphate transport system substrate-binding protein